MILNPKISNKYPKIIPAIIPKRVIIKYAFKLPVTSASSDAPKRTNDPSPKVLVNAANKPPKEILLFLYSDAITIVAPQPGIAPKKAPNIGCNFFGPN